MVFEIADMNFGLTDNSGETIVFGNTEMNNDSLDVVQVQVESPLA